MFYCCTFNEPQSDSFIKSSGALVYYWFPGSLKNKIMTLYIEQVSKSLVYTQNNFSLSAYTGVKYLFKNDV